MASGDAKLRKRHTIKGSNENDVASVQERKSHLLLYDTPDEFVQHRNERSDVEKEYLRNKFLVDDLSLTMSMPTTLAPTSTSYPPIIIPTAPPVTVAPTPLLPTMDPTGSPVTVAPTPLPPIIIPTAPPVTVAPTPLLPTMGPTGSPVTVTPTPLLPTQNPIGSPVATASKSEQPSSVLAGWLL